MTVREEDGDQLPINIVATMTVAMMVLVIALIVVTTAAADLKPYAQSSAAWCEENGGELTNVRSFAHGGLHCEFPNGSAVHMSEVPKDARMAALNRSDTNATT